jgi:predicted metal-dependent phosphoesterase TrpH
MRSEALRLCSLGLLALTPACAAGSAQHGLVDVAMLSAYRPKTVPMATSASATPVLERSDHARYHLLGGDLHCHVQPPDDNVHVARSVHDTVTLARREGLDFVMLTPHVAAGFQEHADLRQAVVQAHRALGDALAVESLGTLLVTAGFEYTDHMYGHAGLGFADLERVLEQVSADEATEHPERFFERWSALGGLTIVNHPLVTPLASGPNIARADLSWRAFTQPELPLRGNIRAIDRLASGFEVYNLTATHLRDRYLQGDTDKTLLATMLYLDHEIPSRNRRMTPVGGTDSHSYHLRSTTYVLAEARSLDAIRDAVVAGRTCVRGPEACSFEARVPSQRWHTLGNNLMTEDRIEVRAQGSDIEIYLDGQSIARPVSNQNVTIKAQADRCMVVRARVDKSLSAPIYVNCNIPT